MVGRISTDFPLGRGKYFKTCRRKKIDLRRLSAAFATTVPWGRVRLFQFCQAVEEFLVRIGLFYTLCLEGRMCIENGLFSLFSSGPKLEFFDVIRESSHLVKTGSKTVSFLACICFFSRCYCPNIGQQKV